MDDTQRDQWAAQVVHKALSGMPAPTGIEARVRRACRDASTSRPVRGARAAQVALTLAVGAALTLALVFGIVARQGGARSPVGRAKVQAGAPASSPTAIHAVTLPQDPSQRFFYDAEGTGAAGAGLTLDVLDWNGTARGTVKVAAAVGSGTVGAPTTVAAVAPDGRRVLTSGGEVLDQTGALVGRLDLTSENGSKLWAEDDAHLCAVDDPLLGAPAASPPAPAQMDLVGLDGSVRHVATVGHFDRRSDVEVLACSLSQDVLAVAQRGPVGGIAAAYTDLWLFRLSTGALLGHRTFANQVFIVSPDARYLAESAAPNHDADVLALPGLTRVADLAGGVVPLGFSGDGSRLLYRVAGSGATPTTSRVVDWASGHVLWQAETVKAQVTTVADPASSAMVLAEGGASPRLLFLDAAGRIRTLEQGGPYRVLFGNASLPLP